MTIAFHIRQNPECICWFILPFLKPGAPEYRENLMLGCRAFRVFASLLPLVGVNIISGGYFQAHGRPILSLFLTLLRQLFILIPSLILLPILFEKARIEGIYGLDGVWSAHAFSDLLSGAIAIFFLSLEYRRHTKRAASPAGPGD